MEDFSTGVFACKMCGECCRGRAGIVVSQKDLARLAEYFKKSCEEVAALYCESSSGKLKVRSGEDLFCIFYRVGKGCSVHMAKPDVCQAWPFFRGNIKDPISLTMAKDFCPGINPNVEYAVFAAAGKAFLQQNGLLANDRMREANALILD